MLSSFTYVVLTINLSFHRMSNFTEFQDNIIQVNGIIAVFVLNKLRNGSAAFSNNVFSAPLDLLKYMSQMGFGVK